MTPCAGALRGHRHRFQALKQPCFVHHRSHGALPRQHHALRRCVPMMRNREVRGHLEEDVSIRLGGIAVENGNFAPLWDKVGAGTPFKLRVRESKRQGRFLGRSFRYLI